MPRRELMTFVERDKCWKKLYQGVPYRVTCKQLGAEPTKLGSLQAANDWWLSQIETLNPRKANAKDYEIAIAAHLDLALVHEQYGQPEAAMAEHRIVKALKLNAGKRNPPALSVATLDPLDGVSDTGRAIMLDRIARNRGTTPKAKTIAPNVETFLTQLRASVKPQSYREVRNYFDDLMETGFFAGTMPLDQINEATVDAHYIYLTQRPIENGGRNKVLGFFRRFIGWLGERRLLPQGLPANLKTKMHRFKVPTKKVKRFADVAKTINGLPDEFRLWALLGANCGMTQADLGALDWSWIDLKAGRLTRQRIKLENVKDAPEVTYKLWPETLAMLKARTNKKGRVFSTAKGGPMYVCRYVEKDGHMIEIKKDLFSTYWNRWDFVEKKNKPKKLKRPANKIPIPLGKFRHIGATTLKNPANERGEPVHRWAVEVFLANVPSKIPDRHYSAEHDNPFFAATDFIRKELRIGA